MYGGANLVPIAVPEICCLTLSLNSNKLFFRTNSANLTSSLVGIFVHDCSSSFCFKAEIPSLCGMLGYRLTTSAITKKRTLRTFSFPFYFVNKITSHYDQYNQPFCINGFKQTWRNSDAFSVGVPQLEITGLRGTLEKHLWIFGKRDWLSF